MTTPEDPSDPPFGWQPPADQPPAYGAPPPAYGAPPPAYGAPPPGYGPPPPYQGAPGYPTGPQFGGQNLAAWGWRVLASILDGLIFGIPTAIIGFATGSQGVLDILNIVVFLVIGYLNGAYGQTPAKRIIGLKVLREQDGQLLGGGMGIVRSIAHLLDAISCLIGYLWPLWDSKRQTFADKIVGTVVIKL
jgi:uncharacterized RDD family membrane protein YckC